MKVAPSEFTTALDRGDQGDFDAFQVGWSGRIDPDGNLYGFISDEGSLNHCGLASRARRLARTAGAVDDDRSRAARSTARAMQ